MKVNVRPEKNLTSEIILLVAISFSVLFAFAPSASAQAGRAVRKPSAEPRPTAQPPASAAEQPRANSSTHPAAIFIVTKMVEHSALMVETRIAFEGFVERLKQSAEVEVREVSTDVTRGDAVGRAKAESEAYVIWLRMEIDAVDSENASVSRFNPGCVYVTYTVYSPQTAKVKAQGRVYQRGYTTDVCVSGAMRTGTPPPERRRFDIPYEERIRRAAQEAANRVLQAFELRLPAANQ